MKYLFCCSLNCTHMQAKRLMTGSTLMVHNNSQPPSNCPWTSNTPKWRLPPWQHPCFECSPLCAGKQSPGSQKSSIRNEKRGCNIPHVDGIPHVWCILHCLMAAFWWNTIKPRQMLGKADIILQLYQITDSVESLVLIKVFCSIKEIKKLEA